MLPFMMSKKPAAAMVITSSLNGEKPEESKEALKAKLDRALEQLAVRDMLKAAKEDDELLFASALSKFVKMKIEEYEQGEGEGGE